MTEFSSRRELREAERQGLVQKPEQVFDLPTGQITLPLMTEQDLPAVSQMLTRKRIREMERQGLLDPHTAAVDLPQAPPVEARSYDEVLAETEEPITSTINTVVVPAASAQAATVPAAVPNAIAPVSAAPIAATDIFHSMAIDVNARKPRLGIVIAIILVVLAAAGAAAYMLGIFK